MKSLKVFLTLFCLFTISSCAKFLKTDKSLHVPIPSTSSIAQEFLHQNTVNYALQNHNFESDIDKNPQKYTIISGQSSDQLPSKSTSDPNPYYDPSTPIQNKYRVNHKTLLHQFNNLPVYKNDQEPYYSPYPQVTKFQTNEDTHLSIPIKLKNLSNKEVSADNLQRMAADLGNLSSQILGRSYKSHDEKGREIYFKDSSPYYDPSLLDKVQRVKDLQNDVVGMANTLFDTSNKPDLVYGIEKTRTEVQNSRNANSEGTSGRIAQELHYPAYNTDLLQTTNINPNDMIMLNHQDIHNTNVDLSHPNINHYYPQSGHLGESVVEADSIGVHADTTYYYSTPDNSTIIPDNNSTNASSVLITPEIISQPNNASSPSTNVSPVADNNTVIAPEIVSNNITSVTITNNTVPDMVSNNTTPVILSNNTTPDIVSNNTTPVIVSNNPTPVIISNNTTPDIVSNNPTPVIVSNNTTPDIVSNNTITPPIIPQPNITNSTVALKRTFEKEIPKVNQQSVSKKVDQIKQVEVKKQLISPIVQKVLNNPVVKRTHQESTNVNKETVKNDLKLRIEEIQKKAHMLLKEKINTADKDIQQKEAEINKRIEIIKAKASELLKDKVVERKVENVIGKKVDENVAEKKEDSDKKVENVEEKKTENVAEKVKTDKKADAENKVENGEKSGNAKKVVPNTQGLKTEHVRILSFRKNNNSQTKA